MKNKDLLYQIGFDMFDAGNDDFITEMDLFKVFQFFGSQSNTSELFEITV